MADLVKFSKQGSIGIITVDNPPVNALSPGVPEGIIECVNKGNADPDVKAMVFTGAGRAFINSRNVLRSLGLGWLRLTKKGVTDMLKRPDFGLPVLNLDHLLVRARGSKGSVHAPPRGPMLRARCARCRSCAAASGGTCSSAERALPACEATWGEGRGRAVACRLPAVGPLRCAGSLPTCRSLAPGRYRAAREAARLGRLLGGATHAAAASRRVRPARHRRRRGRLWQVPQPRASRRQFAHALTARAACLSPLRTPLSGARPSCRSSPPCSPAAACSRARRMRRPRLP